MPQPPCSSKTAQVEGNTRMIEETGRRAPELPRAQCRLPGPATSPRRDWSYGPDFGNTAYEEVRGKPLARRLAQALVLVVRHDRTRRSGSSRSRPWHRRGHLAAQLPVVVVRRPHAGPRRRALGNSDNVETVLHSYRDWLRLAPRHPEYANVQRRLSAAADHIAAGHARRTVG